MLDDHVVILHQEVVHLLDSVVPSFRETLAHIETSAGPILWFPDGSLQAGITAAVRPYWDLCIPPEARDLVCTYTFFSSLPPWPRRNHTLVTTAKYQRRQGFLVIPINLDHDSYPTDLDLSDLPVTVGFMRPLRPAQAESLRDTLVDWVRRLEGRGIRGDGPVHLVPPGIDIHGRRAQFRVDASSTGQDTLNWLILTLLGLGIRVAPVHQVVFDDVANLQRYMGVADGNSFHVPFAPRGESIRRRNDAGEAQHS